MAGAEEITLPYVTITYIHPVVYFKYKENVELGFPEVEELIKYAERLSGNKPYVTLADVRDGISITNEGKRVVADIKNMPLFRGTAAVVKNDIYQLAANFLSLFNRPGYPFRAFTSKERAVEWLLTLPLTGKENS